LSPRWIAYEFYHLKDTELFRPNQQTDIWAFGMTLVELLTGEIPYAHIQSDGPVSKAVSNGLLPEEPIYRDSDPNADLQRYMWSLCRKCWKKEPVQRPLMRDVLKEMSDYRILIDHPVNFTCGEHDVRRTRVYRTHLAEGLMTMLFVCLSCGLRVSTTLHT